MTCFGKGFIVAGLCVALLAHFHPVLADEPPIPIVDVHNQYDGTFGHDDILRYMDRYGIGRMILAPAARADDRALVDFGGQHADRLTIAVRTKDRRLIRNANPQGVMDEVRKGGYGAFEELLLWHGDKSDRKGVAESQVTGGEMTLDIEGPAVRTLVDIARRQNWPMIPHIEFTAAGVKRRELMKQFENLLAANRDVLFGLIHLGQLDEPEARRLIVTHPNVFFLLSQSTDPRKAVIGMTTIFNVQGVLNRDWHNLIVAHPDRFVLSFDAFSGRMWAASMSGVTQIWRAALAKLPTDVAHAVGHKNAERLWHLPPTLAVAVNAAAVPAGPADSPRAGKKGHGK